MRHELARSAGTGVIPALGPARYGASGCRAGTWSGWAVQRVHLARAACIESFVGSNALRDGTRLVDSAPESTLGGTIRYLSLIHI